MFCSRLKIHINIACLCKFIGRGPNWLTNVIEPINESWLGMKFHLNLASWRSCFLGTFLYDKLQGALTSICFKEGRAAFDNVKIGKNINNKINCWVLFTAVYQTCLKRLPGKTKVPALSSRLSEIRATIISDTIHQQEKEISNSRNFSYHLHHTIQGEKREKWIYINKRYGLKERISTVILNLLFTWFFHPFFFLLRN